MGSQNKEVFRDSIGTISEEGKRAFIHPKKPSGRYYKWRSIVSYFLVAFLFAAPFIKINGNQFLLFNVIDRKFNIFGLPFWPQDFYLLVIAMLTSVVFIILFTVVFGRVFCGWVCPQTIFMEMVFRKIEYWIEGDRNKQIKLDKQKWDAEKIKKRLFKWFVFFLISFLIANVFLAYIISGDELLKYITDGPFEHVSTLINLLAFTSVFYFVFAWFREQVCIIVCPYGRLQGVLLDDQTINVAYDYKRGEGASGRKKFRKNENRAAEGYGDCIDCKACVHVCPTGIDIRNGTQLECVNCTACIDSCDEVMDKIGYERGLIRYASEVNIKAGKPFKFTTRMKAYTAFLTLLMSVLVVLLLLRTDVEASILRLPGSLFQREGAEISNLYTYKIINKTSEEVSDLEMRLLSHEGEIEVIGGITDIPRQEFAEGSVFVRIEEENLESSKERIRIGIFSNGELIDRVNTNFLGPQK